MISITQDVHGRRKAVVDEGNSSRIEFVRIKNVGIIVAAPNGEEVFITDDQLELLVNFSKRCVAEEAR